MLIYKSLKTREFIYCFITEYLLNSKDLRAMKKIISVILSKIV